MRIGRLYALGMSGSPLRFGAVVTTRIRPEEKALCLEAWKAKCVRDGVELRFSDWVRNALRERAVQELGR